MPSWKRILTEADEANYITTSNFSSYFAIEMMAYGVVFTNVTSDINLQARKIKTNTTNGDIKLQPNGTGAVSVATVTNYENNVTHDDDLPNRKYVHDTFLTDLSEDASPSLSQVLNAQQHRISNVPDPTYAQDAANKRFVENRHNHVYIPFFSRPIYNTRYYSSPYNYYYWSSFNTSLTETKLVAAYRHHFRAPVDLSIDKITFRYAVNTTTNASFKLYAYKIADSDLYGTGNVTWTEVVEITANPAASNAVFTLVNTNIGDLDEGDIVKFAIKLDNNSGTPSIYGNVLMEWS